MTPFSRLLMAGVLGALALPAAAYDAKDVKTFTLKNGMQFLVLEDSAIPNANMYTFWKVGSRNERPGITGLSHFFEHMMFNGAKKYGPGQFDKVMEAAGGANNAYTTEDITVYTDWFPSSSLKTIFDLESDRIAHLAIDPKMVASEREVVASERRTGLENSSFETLNQPLLSVAFTAHPYSWPVIGYESDIKAWTQHDLESYHRTYYAPNNALVVIAGDVDFAKVKTLATQAFAAIPAQSPPPPVVTVEPKQSGERRLYVQKPSVTSPNLMVAYHVPATKDADTPALKLLATLLSEGRSARLKKSLVDEQKVATDVFAYLPNNLDPTLFYLYAVAAPGVTEPALEQALLAQIKDIRDHGISEADLTKARNLLLVSQYNELQTINGMANALGSYALYNGDYRKLFSMADDYAKVTPAQVQAVAAKYLTKANRTVGVLGSQEDKE
ncbi:M16 family metallopeptidase [Gallaecimonas pentaromativorans]|uniref:M16 family metallopeptidase n=1 Tax=Gallaecimonas pentaromativorans TaxID=584787 RepID=UPI003A933B6B